MRLFLVWGFVGAVLSLGWGQGIGDPTFPNLGNTGYKASHYDINLRYDPSSNFLHADVTMTATAADSDAKFSVDFTGFKVQSVKLDGSPVKYERTDGKLWIEPEQAIAKGREFRLETVYEGNPAQAPTTALEGLKAGWISYPDGAVTVCEPDLAHTWFPCNDHPLNKATFSFEIETPPGYRAIANGVEEQAETSDRHSSSWQMDEPIQTCMAIVAIGKYETSDQIGPEGLKIRNYFPVGERSVYEQSLAEDPAFLGFLESRLGPYPYATYGTIELPQAVSSVNSLMSGAALETVGIPVFSAGSAANDSTLIHEMCHQWMGDCVSISNWEDDIWWVEGFATYAEYMRLEMRQGRLALDQAMQGLYSQLAGNREWLKPGHLTTDRMFSSAAYQGGCMVFHALRLKIGDEAFFKCIRKFIADHKYGNGSTAELIREASAASGQDLGAFFKAWLYGDTIPRLG